MQPSSTDYVALPPILRSATWPAKLPRRYKILAACIAVFLVQYSQSQAMIAPFIVRSTPGELLGPDAVGFIFAVYPLATALATPLPPRVLGLHLLQYELLHRKHSQKPFLPIVRALTKKKHSLLNIDWNFYVASRYPG